MFDDPFRGSDGVSRSDTSNESDAAPVVDKGFDTVRTCDCDFGALQIAD
jgi:hypothetical protein